ncbi:hypothetical protein PXK58_20315 [Phaeobacter gallaeciensis]|uniref:hypothetical protein n=1 Tax=Phaeobacter gallaeciensis TaxID=60890 RepID=UPI00238011DE|nr:hypothetical protein [Phaeobacter gallaeciensis]MDE4276660.1 hypothetical protein [Phaeobacter gallaeciensis]MDE4301890.1 hypothetical protein [Phaeobacter gallaeciensis]MDE5187044.1 hypothetical protein [Phaeobacter gallaeciensis]
MFLFQSDFPRPKLFSISQVRSFLKASILAVPLYFGAQGAHADPMPPLSELVGQTLVGATVESYAVWSVYLAPNGVAQFTYANGGSGKAGWRVADRNVICFDFEGSAEEVCKRGSTYGVGSGWSTVYPQSDGGWRPFQEDPHGSSRIFAAWPGYIRHNPASFTGDLTDALPGTVYIDRPGAGVYAVEFGPGGAGVLLNENGRREVATTYSAGQLCIDEECVNLWIEDGRLALRKDNSDRFEGYLMYLAFGRFTAPPAPAPVKDMQDTEAVAAVKAPPEEATQDTPAADEVSAMGELLASDVCDGGALFDASNVCNDAFENALSKDIARVVSSATPPPDQKGETSPELAAPEIDYPWFGRSADLMIQKVGTRDRRGQTRVDFKNGSPRIGGRVLVPSFTPDSARIVAVTEALALIRFSGPMLPGGCAEAYRWLWVDEADHGLLSEPFGACGKAEDIDVQYRGSLVVTTITPENGVPSTFEIFPYRTDSYDPLRISVTEGPSIDFEPVSEEDWKTIERRGAETQRALDAEAAEEKSRQRKAEWFAAKEAELAERRKPATASGQLDGGNVFDILAQEAVQSVIASSEHAEGLRQVLSEHFAESVHMPSNRRIGDIYAGLACGPEGCKELMVVAFFDSRTQDATGFINFGLTPIRFGTEEWLEADKSGQAVSKTFQEMLEAIPDE